MVNEYLNYDDIKNYSTECINIWDTHLAKINLEPNNKKCLFILGMLFRYGVKIKILNENELNLEQTNKSFSMMPYVWSKLGDKNFPNNDYSNVITEMDKRIENIKRIGVRLHKIKDNTKDKKIFLICPVRNASEEQRKWIENFVQEKTNEGYIIHAPHLHTVQTDLFGGYSICVQNAEAVASSEEIDLYYDQNSTGSIFDLGVAYALKKPLRLLNEQEIIFDDNDSIDNLIKNWPYNWKLKNNKKEETMVLRMKKK